MRPPSQAQPRCAPRLDRGGEVMGLFGALVRTVVNVATLPVAVVKDVRDHHDDHNNLHNFSHPEFLGYLRAAVEDARRALAKAGGTQ